MSSQDPSSTAEYNLPDDKMIFFPRLSMEMETRLAGHSSSLSALQNAAGLNEEEFKQFKDVLQKTAREYLDLKIEVGNQDRDQWQFFVNELWESKIGYMMSNYEEQWPMMVYIQKYLGKRRRRQRKAARQRDRERGEAGMPEVDHAYTDTKRGSSSPASDGTGGLSSFDTKPAIQPSQGSIFNRSCIAKGKENAPSDEGHTVGSPQSSTAKRSRQRWTPVVEIPVRRKANKSHNSAFSGAQPISEMQVGGERMFSQPAPSTSQAVKYGPVKEFLESCHPNLEELLPLFINADVNESCLMALVLSPQQDRMAFLLENVEGMEQWQMVAFDNNCEVQSWDSA